MDIENLLSEKQFSPDQPVKKNLWESANFTVALICLKAGLEIPPHPEPLAAFFTVLEGRGVFTSGGDSVELGPGGGVTISPNDLRGIKSIEDLVVLGIHDPH